MEARALTDGALLWSWAPPDGAPTGALVATRNLLFVGTAGATHAVDAIARRSVWVHPRGGPLSLSREGILIIAGSDGVLTAIDVR